MKYNVYKTTEYEGIKSQIKNKLTEKCLNKKKGQTKKNMKKQQREDEVLQIKSNLLNGFEQMSSYHSGK